MGNTVAIEFAGDSDKLTKAAKKATEATDAVTKASKDAGEGFEKSSKSSAGFTDKIGKLGAGVSGMSDALDQAGSLLSDFNQIQNAGYEKAQRLARAQGDVEQAQLDGKQSARDLRQAQIDLNQAQRDGAQSAIDVEQAQNDVKRAQFDAATATRDYNTAVKEHGKNSEEARAAALDLADAQTGVKQANEDVKQAQLDASQAVEDGKQAQQDASQAVRDGKDAQLDLNDAMREAHPTDLSKFADQMELVTPLLQGLIGITGLVTAAQWAWNAAQLASPTTWIIAGIVALIAIVVLLVKHWDWVKKAGAAAWDWIKKAASNTWDFIKKIPGWLGSAFKNIASVLTWPFRTAFNFIADAWNHTIGRLQWSVPGWVPGIGGNSIGVPQLPHFHSGGMVPGAPGTEMLAVLQAGERVIPAGGGGMTYVRGDGLVDYLIEAIAREVRLRGGDPGTLGLGGSGA